jgi:hypothetical protein
MARPVDELVRGLDRTRPPVDLRVLKALAEESAVRLPSDYLEFMSQTNGGDGDFGSRWVEFWPVSEIVEVAAGENPYDGVLLFAGDGANTIYGFDAHANGEIVEGDWIGLRQDQLIRHGISFTRFLEALLHD